METKDEKAREGSRFEGTFRDGKPDGEGAAKWPDGARHEGTFRDGKPDGEGGEPGPEAA